MTDYTEYQEIQELKARVGKLEEILHDLLGAIRDEAVMSLKIPTLINYYGYLHDKLYEVTDYDEV